MCTCTFFRDVGACIDNNIITPGCDACRLIGSFAQRNWAELCIYVLAWGTLFACIGAMYGFPEAALPMAIGAGCAAGFGILLGVATKLYFGNNTPTLVSVWDMAKTGAAKLDTAALWMLGTVLLAVALTAIKTFPLYTGIFFGTIGFNHLTALIAFKKPFSHAEPWIKQVADFKKTIEELTRRVLDLENLLLTKGDATGNERKV